MNRTWRGAIALSVLFLATGLAAASAAQAATFTLHGHVLKGAERKPLTGVAVSLHVVQGNEELPGGSVTSGQDGGFEFASLTLDPQRSYFLSVEFENAYYTEGPIQAKGGEALQDLIVYDVGRDMGSVRVTNHHIIVEREQADLKITEIVVFENSGTTAYLGTGLNHAENVGVRLGLPASIKGFQPGMGGDDQTVRVQGRDLASQRPIPPGTRPFSFTYHVPMSGRMDLSHRLYFPTDRFVVLIEDPKLKLESKSLEFAGERDQGGRKFQIYQAANFPVGAEVTIRIQGAGLWSNPAIYPWLVAPFLIIAALVIAARRGRKAATDGTAAAKARAAVGDGAVAAGGPRPLAPEAPNAGPSAAPDDEFATLYLYLIDALDRGLERGEFSKESYTLVRGNLKRRLESILADQPRTGTR
ncbi:MAG: hypothetical protein ACRENN_01285 [Candidatus Eiseniibacteriota bacterium]